MFHVMKVWMSRARPDQGKRRRLPFFRPCDAFHARTGAVSTVVGVDDVNTRATVFLERGNLGHVPFEGGGFLIIAGLDQDEGLSLEGDDSVAFVGNK